MVVPVLIVYLVNTLTGALSLPINSTLFLPLLNLYQWWSLVCDMADSLYAASIIFFVSVTIFLSFTQNLLVYRCSCKFSNVSRLIFSRWFLRTQFQGFAKLTRILQILSLSWRELSIGVLYSQLPVLPLAEKTISLSLLNCLCIMPF